MAKKFSRLQEQMSSEAREKAQAKAQEMLAELPLHEVRQARWMTQKVLADVLQVKQPAVAKLEKRTDMYISTLRSHIQAIDLAEDRDRFRQIMDRLNIPMAESDMASSVQEALDIAERIGYPLMVRPSYVLGGRGMEIVYDSEMLKDYAKSAVGLNPDRPILIDKYLDNAIEAEADAIADGFDAFVPAVMEHIEQAGVHSGDSACVIPPVNIPERHLETIYEYTRKIANELKVIGLMNMQYAIWQDRVYVLEANPRASRTVPIVSKVCGISMARIATQIMLGKKLRDFDLSITKVPYFGVKEAVFPFSMFPEVDPVIGPEMRSTGEVLGLASSYGLAFYKAQKAAKSILPTDGAVLITVCERDRDEKLAQAARHFAGLGFKLFSTEGTTRFLHDHGLESEPILKLHQGRPNIVDAIKNGEIQLIVNTPAGKLSVTDDSYIRKSAIQHNVPYITTVAAAVAAAEGIKAKRNQQDTIKSLQEYHAEIQ
ncbi:MAG: ATP-grasp domain-containing protein [Desulfovermiculus sp.]